MSALPRSVGTIGAGNMAEAILRGLLRAGMTRDQLVASDPSEERREQITRQLGVRTTHDNAEVVRGAELVVLAVKPQQLEAAVCAFPRDAAPLFVSIIAGATTASLRRLLGDSARIVRSMPNTPALLGAGITAVASDSGVANIDLVQASAVLGAIGSVVHVPEAALDSVTGLSGSGPAYLYAFVEALLAAGVREGLPPDVARELAVETVHGAARMLRETGETPAELRRRVSSPGGTTLAGLAALEQAGFAEAIAAAVHAATARAKELGQE